MYTPMPTMIRKLAARTPGTSERPMPKPAWSTASASHTMMTAAMTWTIATWRAITTPRTTRTSRPRKYETMTNLPCPGPNAWMTP